MPFEPATIDRPALAERADTQRVEDITVSAAIVSPDETAALTGIDLYQDGVQPIWLEVTNHADSDARVIIASIDDQYFSPLEVAWIHRKRFRKDARPQRERWFLQNRLPRRVPGGASRTGIVFIHAADGTQSFNVDVVANGRVVSQTFFLTPDDFEPDYMRVDFSSLYSNEDLRSLDTSDPDELHTALTELVSRRGSPGAGNDGDPFNAVLIGSGPALLRALLRSNWRETNATEDFPPATGYRDRGPDGNFVKSTQPSTRQRLLRIWLTPLTVDGQAVWIARTGTASPSGLGEPDAARNALLQDLWYAQSVARIGMLGDANNAEAESDGGSAVLFIPDGVVALDDTEALNWATAD